MCVLYGAGNLWSDVWVRQAGLFLLNWHNFPSFKKTQAKKVKSCKCQNCQNLHAGVIHVPHMRLPNTFRKDFAKSHDVVARGTLGMPGRVENIHVWWLLRLVGEFLGLPYDSPPSVSDRFFFALCKASTVAYYFAFSSCPLSRLRLQLKVGKELVAVKYRHLNYEAWSKVQPKFVIFHPTWNYVSQ